jgi:hypothetical protein
LADDPRPRLLGFTAGLRPVEDARKKNQPAVKMPMEMYHSRASGIRGIASAKVVVPFLFGLA